MPVGGIVALVGSNGAGKSTVAAHRHAAGDALLSGTVMFSGEDITALPGLQDRPPRHGPRGRGPRGVLEPDGGGEPDLGLPPAGRAQTHGRTSSARTARFAILGERRKQMAGTLSGGQQRLLSLAKVLVVPPKILVADELSLGLAPVVVDTVYEGLAEINRNGTALVVVEQQVHRVLDLSHKAVVLDRGAVAYQGDPAGAGAGRRVLMARREAVAAAEPADRPMR